MKIRKKRSEKYWALRAAQRMFDYQEAAEQTASDIGKAYAAANSSMQADMHKIFGSFERAFKISENQAKQILSAVGNGSAMKELQKAALKLPDPEQRQLALDALQSAPAYSWRIARLDDMLDKVAENCNALYKADVEKTTDFLGKITKQAYNRTTYDLQVGTGTLGAAFDEIPDSRIKQILRTNWSGNTYSKRIYANVEDMQIKLKQTLLEGMMTGEGEREIAAKVSERWQIGYNDARRLIRTETTYVTNQAELDSYKDAGIDKYKYVSVLDSRTSEVCHDLNGKTFLISEAVPGKNYPPMHPWCRSTTVAVLGEELWSKSVEELEKESDELSKELGLDDDVSFDEWFENLQKTESGKVKYISKVIPESNVSNYSGAKEKDAFFGTVAKKSNKYMLLDQVTNKEDAIVMTNNIAVVKGNAVLVTGKNSAIYLKDWQFRKMESDNGASAFAVKINKKYFKEYTFQSGFDFGGEKDTFETLWEKAVSQQKQKQAWKSGGRVIISRNSIIS